MPETTRTETESGILEHLDLKGPSSRAELSREIGISKAAVGTRVARLLEEGIIRENQVAAGGDRPVGRPGGLVALNCDHAHVVGVDAGIGFVFVLRLDLCGEVRADGRVEIPIAEQTPEAIADIVCDLVDRVSAGAPRIAGVAIAIPGIIMRDGFVMRAPILGWQGVPFRDLIEMRLKRYGTLALENDANALAMGEVIRGHVQPDATDIFISMDAGVGGSIVRKGAIMDGHSGLAGEFGHIFVHPSDGRRAMRLEDVVGRQAVLTRYAEIGGRSDTLAGFIADLDAGCPEAEQVMSEWVEVMAQALSTLTSVLNPGSVIFGGSMTALLSRSMGRLEAAYERLLMHGTIKPRFVVADSAEHSVARGCADILRARIFRPPNE
jgi:predicted NBD/HSP70 family sugar kinase